MQIIVTNVFWKMAAIKDGYIPGSIEMKGEFILDWLILFLALPCVKPAGNSITSFIHHTSVKTIKIRTRGGDGGSERTPGKLIGVQKHHQYY